MRSEGYSSCPVCVCMFVRRYYTLYRTCAAARTRKGWAGAQCSQCFLFCVIAHAHTRLAIEIEKTRRSRVPVCTRSNARAVFFLVRMRVRPREGGGGAHEEKYGWLARLEQCMVTDCKGMCESSEKNKCQDLGMVESAQLRANPEWKWITCNRDHRYY